ncbi:MAG: cytochrome c [Gemmatimonadetes bacterium]|jgi:mono/diheme cytochrome c family protein|nr:cytochrome c [Gemmatimonadota bacterium]MBT6146579.1 cytochrome c [Gemmatimonadota bacterium]
MKWRVLSLYAVLPIVLVLTLVGCGGQAQEGQTSTEVTATSGQRLYRDHGCGLCHGETGHGNGRMAQSLDPPPRDFSRAGQFRLGHSVDEVAEAIRTGAGGRGAMPGYGHLPEPDRRALATYIVSLATD